MVSSKYLLNKMTPPLNAIHALSGVSDCVVNRRSQMLTPRKRLDVMIVILAVPVFQAQQSWAIWALLPAGPVRPTTALSFLMCPPLFELLIRLDHARRFRRRMDCAVGSFET